MGEQRVARLVGESLRVPLHGQKGEGTVDNAFDHVISGAADRDKPSAHTVNGLMVGGINLDAAPVELVKEITAAEITVKNIVELVASDPFVGFGGVDMLRDVAAEVDIYELKPFADTEHGLFLCGKTGEYFKLEDV